MHLTLKIITSKKPKTKIIQKKIDYIGKKILNSTYKEINFFIKKYEIQ